LYTITLAAKFKMQFSASARIFTIRAWKARESLIKTQRARRGTGRKHIRVSRKGAKAQRSRFVLLCGYSSCRSAGRRTVADLTCVPFSLSSFVTAKPDPNDVDAVVWLAGDFAVRVSDGDVAAVELEMMLVTRQPEEIFAAEDRRDWDDWVEFFSRTREADGRRKGVVEVEL
jgi:hypothetical protein